MLRLMAKMSGHATSHHGSKSKPSKSVCPYVQNAHRPSNSSIRAVHSRTAQLRDVRSIEKRPTYQSKRHRHGLIPVEMPLRTDSAVWMDSAVTGLPCPLGTFGGAAAAAAAICSATFAASASASAATSGGRSLRLSTRWRALGSASTPISPRVAVKFTGRILNMRRPLVTPAAARAAISISSAVVAEVTGTSWAAPLSACAPSRLKYMIRTVAVKGFGGGREREDGGSHRDAGLDSHR